MLHSESNMTPNGSLGGGITLSLGFTGAATTPQHGFKPPPSHNSKNSVKLKYLMKNGLMNDDVKHKMDMDRIKEEEEDFLQTDRRKILAIESYKMKPLPSKRLKGEVIQRTIIGENDLFKEGKSLMDSRCAKKYQTK